MAETRLMTYAELGEAIGRSEVAARSVAMRKRWRRVLGNDGKARVTVPVEVLTALQAKADTRTVDLPDDLPDEQAVAPPDFLPDSRADARALMDMLEARVAELDKEAKQGRVAMTRVAVLETLVESERERAAELRQDRDRWHAIATERRSWWLWRRRA
jgi:hypothetical protein